MARPLQVWQLDVPMVLDPKIIVVWELRSELVFQAFG
jgi:hypothetical protein